MKTLILSIIVFFWAYISNAQIYSGSFIFEGRNRNYEVHLPQNFKPNMPLVISLHGYTETIEWYKNYTLLHEVTDTAGFITVYPAAIGNSWNSGLIAPGWPHIDITVNDVGFISALIDTLEAHYDIDMSRVYCCGYSLGGEMTYKLTGELGHRFAAVASITGLLNENSVKTCNPVRPFPIIHMHGTSDTYETWNGDNKNLLTVPQTINFWLEKNGCSLNSDTVSLCNLDPSDGCTVEKISYTNCSESGCFIFYKIKNGGHHWPDAAFNWGGGNLNRDINANVEILNFFKKYQNPLVNIAYAKSVEIDLFYDQLGEESLIVRSKISNPENHSVHVWAVIQGLQSQFIDSLQLFDDGLHDDGGNSDNIWGNTKSIQGLSEDIYKVDVSTHDDYFNEVHQLLYVSPERFNKLGPVDVEEYYFDEGDTVPDPGDRLKFTLKLKNNSKQATAKNIRAELTSVDTLVFIAAYNHSFDDLPAGETATSNSKYSIRIYDEHTVNSEIPIVAHISSDNYVFWRDTFSILVAGPDVLKDTKEPISNVYPNPVKNELTIEFDDNISTKTSITLYDITGKVVYSENLESAILNHTIDLASLMKGIYLINISNEQYSYTEKVIKAE